MSKPTLVPAPGDDDDSAADRDCFRRLARGGPAGRQAAARLYDLYAPRLRAFLRVQRLSPEHIEELVQEVFVRLLGHAQGLKDVQSPRAYLWRVLRHAFTDHLRRMQRQRRHFTAPAPEEPGPEIEEEGPPSWLAQLASDGHEHEQGAHYECVQRALERFRRDEPDKATAIDLVAIEGFDGRELAEALGKAPGAAREYLSQARRLLKARVQALCGGLYA